ncbi:glycerol kinase GlpK [Noviherbaspirillum sedimenti]|uniref:Glycerol kinase n=1 Tax=Noviherbaspirillum sedimenti TaxID=2320865 RepID=A0A3A3G325_9BURK|nr:glycerol kinase GlpK [Noviherbaspirillum sedimenti]RJG02254.1 glycerol kinase [Noviherbaspirillum sedimenti]
MPQYILALDQGTTSSRAILFDHGGHIRGCAQQEFRQIFPQPGWVEHDANEIWETQLAVARQVLRENQLSPAAIAAIGISNQRETTVLWDRVTGKPVANAIVWQDRRTAAACDALRQRGLADLVQAKTGLELDAYFSATKIQWLLAHVAGARERAERGELAFGTIDSWLAFKLTGAHVTDTSNASRTMLFNLHSLQWDDELLELLDIPRAILPTVVPANARIGHCHPDCFGAPVLLAGLAGDQQAATFGQACHHPGMAKNTYGTGCFMLMNTGHTAIRSQNRLLSTIGWTLEGRSGADTTYMLEGSVFMAGATIQWLRDCLQIIQHASEVEALAGSVADTGGVMLVPAFAGLGAPHWDPYARGTLVGMTRGTGRAHIARAALESIAYQTADVLQAMQADSALPLSELRVNGGAASNNLLMQFQADILGVQVVRPAVTETSALGAAYLAGLAVGFWSSPEELATHWSMERRFEPAMAAAESQLRLANWRRAVERSKAWQFDNSWWFLCPGSYSMCDDQITLLFVKYRRIPYLE